jgi:DMSO/TMAO reductase YedYZ molybdopterin-dependent catalytic subunit
MLAYAWDGVPLPLEHGFPLRLYVPNVYGMKQPKWIVAIDAIDHWEPGYWVARGWDREGRMRATSVIDVASVSAVDAQGRITLTAGGIAHAGAMRVSKVEVRVGDGDWREAGLRDPLSGTTWVVWRVDLTMPYAEGGAASSFQTVSVRCYDGAGTLQAGELHTRRVQLTPSGH